MSNAHLAQPRRPPGSPDAGQWTARQWGESEVDLGDWAAQGGSYEYPPHIPQPDKATQWWLKEVQIPESVLKQVDSAYSHAAERDMQDAVDEWMKTSPRGRYGQEDFERKRIEVAVNGLSGRPHRIPKVAMRPLVRVASLHWYAQENLDPATGDQISNATLIELPGHDPMTPAQAVERYGLERIRDSFEIGEDPDIVELRLLRNEFGEQISALRSEIIGEQ